MPDIDALGFMKGFDSTGAPIHAPSSVAGELSRMGLCYNWNEGGATYIAPTGLGDAYLRTLNEDYR